MRRNYTYRLTGKNYVVRIEDGMMMNVNHPVFLNWLADGNKPLPPVEEPTPAIENKRQAQQLLADTDWIEFPSVSDKNQPKYLINVDEFIAYRVALRQIVSEAKDGKIEWPKKPSVKWS